MSSSKNFEYEALIEVLDQMSVQHFLDWAEESWAMDKQSSLDFLIKMWKEGLLGLYKYGPENPNNSGDTFIDIRADEISLDNVNTWPDYNGHPYIWMSPKEATFKRLKEINSIAKLDEQDK